MNKFLLLIWICFCALAARAQQELDSNSFVLRQLIPLSPTRAVTVQQNLQRDGLPTFLHLQSFSSLSSTKTSKLVPLTVGSLKTSIKSVFAWDDKINILSTLYYPGPGRSNFILQQFDAVNLSEQNRQVIDAVATPKPDQSSAYNGYAIAPDSNRIGFYSWIYAYSTDSVRINVQVYDRAMQKEWSKQFTLPYLNNRFFIKNCALRSNGEFFLFVENYEGKINAETVIRPNRIEHLALRFQQELDTVQRIKAVLNKGAYLSSMQFGLAPNEKLYGIGIWQLPRFTTESGICILQLNPDGQTYTQSLSPQPKSLYQNAEKAARQDTALGARFTSVPFFSYNIDQLHFLKDGQVYVQASYVNDYLLLRYDGGMNLQAVSVVPGLRYGFFEDPYDVNFFFRGKSAYCLQSQVAGYKLVRIAENGALVHATINSRTVQRRPQFALNTRFCTQVDPETILLAATEARIPFNLPRALTFRFEKIEATFKDN